MLSISFNINASIADLRESAKLMRLISGYEKKYKIQKNVLLSIALQESSRYYAPNFPILWPWTVNYGGKSYYFDSKKEAIKYLTPLLRKGHRNFDVGCMQINYKYHGHNFRSLEEAFSPSHNIKYAAEFLSKTYKKQKAWKISVAKYHGSGPRGQRYAQRVYKIAAHIISYKKKFRYYLAHPRKTKLGS